MSIREKDASNLLLDGTAGFSMQSFNKNLDIMTRHHLLMPCGAGFVQINANVAQASQQCF